MREASAKESIPLDRTRGESREAMSDFFSKLSTTIELFEAVAVVEYMVAPPQRQEILRTKYITLLKEKNHNDLTADENDYTAEELDRKRSHPNGLTLDQILDDPRRGQGGRY
jgi:hypothetical protein